MELGKLAVLNDRPMMVFRGESVESTNGVVTTALNPAAAQAILAALAAVADFVAKAEQKKWQDTVSDKLAAVIQNTERILEELIAMRVWFREELKELYRQILRDVIMSSADSVDVFMASYDPKKPLSANQRERAEKIRDRVEAAMFQLAQGGPAGYTGVAAAMMLLAGLFRVLDEPVLSARKAVEKCRGYFELWIDPSQPKSVTSSIAFMEKRYSELKNAVEGFPKGGYIGYTSRRVGHGEYASDETTYFHGSLPGSFDTGFVASMDFTSNDGPHRAPFPGYGGELREQGASQIINSLAAQLNSWASEGRDLRATATTLATLVDELHRLIEQTRIIENNFKSAPPKKDVL